MQIERAILGVTTLGPGSRLAIWVNGCDRHCKGCVSVRLQAKRPENETDEREFLKGFDLSRADGVTVSGGEPFDQPQGLLRAVSYLKEAGIDDILVYTGYTYEELKARRDPATDAVLKQIAVLIDGPYVSLLDRGRGNLKGSANQRVIVLNKEFSARYAAYECDRRTMQEFRAGNVLIGVGIPDRAYIERFLKNE